LRDKIPLFSPFEDTLFALACALVLQVGERKTGVILTAGDAA
jgi:hypothetical protein